MPPFCCARLYPLTSNPFHMQSMILMVVSSREHYFLWDAACQCHFVEVFPRSIAYCFWVQKIFFFFFNFRMWYSHTTRVLRNRDPCIHVVQTRVSVSSWIIYCIVRFIVLVKWPTSLPCVQIYSNFYSLLRQPFVVPEFTQKTQFQITTMRFQTPVPMQVLKSWPMYSLASAQSSFIPHFYSKRSPFLFGPTTLD